MNIRNDKIDTFSNRLYLAMKQNNINQIELSEKTAFYGKEISQSLINKYLKGKALARQDNIYILSKVLNVSEAWLMGFDVKIERIPDMSRSNLMEITASDSAMAPLLDIDDIAYIKPQETFKSGDTIYFRLDEKVLIRKIIEIDNNDFEFHAMNPYFPIIKYTKKELKEKGFIVIGKVIKVENQSAFK